MSQKRRPAFVPGETHKSSWELLVDAAELLVEASGELGPTASMEKLDDAEHKIYIVRQRQHEHDGTHNVVKLPRSE
jgi:hypothetical protein